MPSLSVTTINILLVLLPGFISTAVERAVFYRPKESVFDRIVNALVHTLFVYLVYSLFFYLLLDIEYPLFGLNHPVTTNNEKISIYVNNHLSYLALILLSVLWGCTIGWLKNKDFLLKLPRKLGITQQTSHNSVWMDVISLYKDAEKLHSDDKIFSGKRVGCYLLVYLTDGRKILGWPRFYSNEFTDGPQVFLTNAVWIFEDNPDHIEIPAPGILINGAEIKYINFVYGEKNESIHQKRDEG